MITVTLKYGRIINVKEFKTMSDALIFARASSIGTSFRITEGKVLLAKGTIENYKGDF